MKKETLIFVVSLLCCVGVASAADTKPSMPAEPTPEMRQKMAEHHQKMADCLKSEKPVSECHQMMMKECETMGTNACPMMGAHMGKRFKGKAR